MLQSDMDSGIIPSRSYEEEWIWMDVDSIDIGIVTDCQDNICVHNDVTHPLLFIVSHIITIQSYVGKINDVVIIVTYCVRHRMEIFLGFFLKDFNA